MAKSGELIEEKELAEELILNNTKTVDEMSSVAEEKLPPRDLDTEMKILFRIGAILVCGED